MNGFIKMCDADSRSRSMAEAFSQEDFDAYGLSELEGRERTLMISKNEPRRKGRDGDLWLCSDVNHEGERLHELEVGRNPAYVQKPIV